LFVKVELSNAIIAFGELLPLDAARNKGFKVAV
jgi:hypothetical protein